MIGKVRSGFPKKIMLIKAWSAMGFH